METDDDSKFEVTGGVPQGRVLGPLLSSIVYDGVLQIDLGKEVDACAYADDLVVIVKAKDETCLMEVGNNALGAINQYEKPCPHSGTA